MLKKISQGVLKDVWIRRARAFTVTVVATLVGIAIIGWLNLTAKANAPTSTSWISCVAPLFAVAGPVSSLAVYLLWFR